MPWQPKDAKRFTKKANTPGKSKQWSAVSKSVLDRGGSDESAIRQANSVIRKRSISRPRSR